MPTENRKKISLYKTSTSGNVATISELQYGEVAINYNSDSPFLMFKDNEDAIQKIPTLATSLSNESKFQTLSQYDINGLFKLPNTYVKANYPSITDVAFTINDKNVNLHTAIQNIDNNVALLANEIIDNEEVIANSITTIQGGTGLDDSLSYTPNQSSNYIKEASSLKDADDKLDTQIKTLNDSKASTSSLGAESDARKDVTGIQGDAYTANTSSNYIKNASSLNDADNKLDSQIKTLNDEVLNNEKVIATSITSIQEGSGLDKSLSYTPNQSSNYIKDASSLKDADDKLDAQIKILETSVSNAATNESLSTLDGKVTTLNNEVLKNEKTIAASLTKLQSSTGLDKHLNIGTAFDGIPKLQGCKSIIEAIIALTKP